jgi:hypothetical protein
VSVLLSPPEAAPARKAAPWTGAPFPLKWRFSCVGAESLRVRPPRGFFVTRHPAAVRGCGCRSRSARRVTPGRHHGRRGPARVRASRWAAREREKWAAVLLDAVNAIVAIARLRTSGSKGAGSCRPSPPGSVMNEISRMSPPHAGHRSRNSSLWAHVHCSREGPGARPGRAARHDLPVRRPGPARSASLVSYCASLLCPRLRLSPCLCRNCRQVVLVNVQATSQTCPECNARCVEPYGDLDGGWAA